MQCLHLHNLLERLLCNKNIPYNSMPYIATTQKTLPTSPKPKPKKKKRNVGAPWRIQSQGSHLPTSDSPDPMGSIGGTGGVMIVVGATRNDSTCSMLMILLMDQKSSDHQLRLVVYPIIIKYIKVLYMPGGAGFLPSALSSLYVVQTKGIEMLMYLLKTKIWPENWCLEDDSFLLNTVPWQTRHLCIFGCVIVDIKFTGINLKLDRHSNVIQLFKCMKSVTRPWNSVIHVSVYTLKLIDIHIIYMCIL